MKGLMVIANEKNSMFPQGKKAIKIKLYPTEKIILQHIL